MPQHLTFFGTLTERTETLYWTLQHLYKLECKETRTPEQDQEYQHYHAQAHEEVARFRTLLDSIEREHGLSNKTESEQASSLRRGQIVRIKHGDRTGNTGCIRDIEQTRDQRMYLVGDNWYSDDMLESE